MKRIVICCDGSWKGEKDLEASNVRKIALACEATTGSATHRVYYAGGPGGIGGRLRRLIDGAFALSLDQALDAAYKFLATNYEPGDEIFVFGFSRGAYTARSLVGMLGEVGLLIAANASDYHVSHAAALYRARPAPAQTHPDTGALRWFRRKCHAVTPRVAFLGVFDTVGELGIPFTSRMRYQFHNVELTSLVDVARQALAIHERRRAFQPCIWTTPEPPDSADVKQVWFTGVHTDIGGGYAESDLSNLTLRWMAREARRHGLELSDAALGLAATPPPPDAVDAAPQVHDSLSRGYRLYNAVIAVRNAVRPPLASNRFRRGWRVLEQPEDRAIYLADSAYERWLRQTPEQRDREAPNLGWWLKELDRGDVLERVESCGAEGHMESLAPD